MQPGQCFLSRLFSVKQLTFEIYTILCQYSYHSFIKGSKNKKMVKLTFWTANSSHQVVGMSLTKVWVMYVLFNVLRWLWNIYEGAELPSVYFITNTKHCITYLALTKLFPVLVLHPEMYTLCRMLLYFV